MVEEREADQHTRKFLSCPRRIPDPFYLRSHAMRLVNHGKHHMNPHSPHTTLPNGRYQGQYSIMLHRDIPPTIKAIVLLALRSLEGGMGCTAQAAANGGHPLAAACCCKVVRSHSSPDTMCCRCKCTFPSPVATCCKDHATRAAVVHTKEACSMTADAGREGVTMMVNSASVNSHSTMMLADL